MGDKFSHRQKEKNRKGFRDDHGDGYGAREITHYGQEHLPHKVEPSAPPARPVRINENRTRQLASQAVYGTDKIVYLDAIENERGKALRLSEVHKGKRTTIVLPAELLVSFEDALSKVTPSLVTL